MDVQELIAELRLQMKSLQDIVPAGDDKQVNKANLISKHGELEESFSLGYISADEYCQIVELEKFLHTHPEVDNHHLTRILHGNVFYFGFLRRLHETIPDLPATLRLAGAKFVAGIYVGTQLTNIYQQEV